MSESSKPFVGRGAVVSPGNRFEAIHLADDFEQLADGDELLAGERRIKTQFFVDASQSIIAKNDSPDVFFDYSVNAYRGCEHGCAYWYAQPESSSVENRTVLLISACNRRRSSVKYRPLAGFQNNRRSVPNEQ
ncbi:MAG: hypothetical protein J0M17_24945 [Planctomycetes bacterium]|nr:hypothetical protein [Planctomycetota bacterium]